MRLFFSCKSEKDVVVGKGGGDKYLKITFTIKGKPQYYLMFSQNGHLQIQNKNKEVIFNTKYEG